MRYRINIFLALVMLANFAKGQTHRFIYDVIYKKDSTSKVTTKENYILDIRKSETLFYTRDYYLADSLINNNIPFPKDMKLNTSNIITHKIGSNLFEEYDLIENTVLNLKSENSQNWKLTDEKKQIKNLTLQKATTTWGGRHWIAWFTTNLPFPEGPHKLHGLPGLIVELFDDKNNYRFELAKSEKIESPEENQFIAMSKQMSIPVDLLKYKTMKLKYYESPVSFIKNGIGDSKVEDFFLNDGTVVNSKNQREINNQLRNAIKKYNNPIELDKAITYP